MTVITFKQLEDQNFCWDFSIMLTRIEVWLCALATRSDCQTSRVRENPAWYPECKRQMGGSKLLSSLEILAGYLQYYFCEASK